MKIQGFDARSYDRIVTLVAPGLRSRSPFKERERALETGGFLWVVFNEQTLEVALHSHKGVIEDSTGWTGPSGLQAFAEKHEAQLAIAVESAGLERFLTRWGARTDLQDSFVEQWLIVAENIRELIDEGALYTWPQLWPTNWPRPTAAIVETTFGLVFPHNRSVIILLNDEQHKVDTALVLVRDESGAFSHCVGPEMLRRYVSLESGSLVNDTQAVKRWVESSLMP